MGTSTVYLAFWGSKNNNWWQSLTGAANRTLRPFLGCLRGLRMNGVPLDLEGKVNEEQGIRRNCTGQCLNATIPCRNSGQCIEGYASYTCDCNNTAFDGFYCHKGEFMHAYLDFFRTAIYNYSICLLYLFNNLLCQTLELILSLVHGWDTTYGRSLYQMKRFGPTGSTRTMTTSASATMTQQTTSSSASALSTRQLYYSTSAPLFKTTLLFSSKKTVKATQVGVLRNLNVLIFLDR